METLIPSAGDLRDRLAKLGHGEVKALAKESGVPFTTLWKLRTGETSNPGIETVRKFLPHLAASTQAA